MVLSLDRPATEAVATLLGSSMRRAAALLGDSRSATASSRHRHDDERARRMARRKREGTIVSAFYAAALAGAGIFEDLDGDGVVRNDGRAGRWAGALASRPYPEALRECQRRTAVSACDRRRTDPSPAKNLT